jgi:hypothetical protein
MGTALISDLLSCLTSHPVFVVAHFCQLLPFSDILGFPFSKPPLLLVVAKQTAAHQLLPTLQCTVQHSELDFCLTVHHQCR